MRQDSRDSVSWGLCESFGSSEELEARASKSIRDEAEEKNQKIEEQKRVNEELRKAICHRGTENEVMEATLLRLLSEKRFHTPKDLLGTHPHTYEAHAHAVGSSPEIARGNLRTFRGGEAERRESLPHTGPLLTLKQRFELATSFNNQNLCKQLEAKTLADNAAVHLKDVIANGKIDAAEMRRDAFEFKRDVVINAEDPKTGKTVGEKLLLWLENRVAKKTHQLSKLKLKHKTLQVKAHHGAHSHRGTRYDSANSSDLHPIDFHQLRIENEQCAGKVEEANQIVAVQKSRCSKVLQLQSRLRQNLLMFVEEGRAYSEKMSEREAMLKKSELEVDRATKERDSSKNENKRLVIQARASQSVPKILDFVHQKALEQSLLKDLKNWTRKVEVAELEQKRVKIECKKNLIK